MENKCMEGTKMQEEIRVFIHADLLDITRNGMDAWRKSRVIATESPLLW